MKCFTSPTNRGSRQLKNFWTLSSHMNSPKATLTYHHPITIIFPTHLDTCSTNQYPSNKHGIQMSSLHENDKTAVLFSYPIAYQPLTLMLRSSPGSAQATLPNPSIHPLLQLP